MEAGQKKMLLIAAVGCATLGGCLVCAVVGFFVFRESKDFEDAPGFASGANRIASDAVQTCSENRVGTRDRGNLTFSCRADTIPPGESYRVAGSLWTFFTNDGPQHDRYLSLLVFPDGRVRFARSFRHIRFPDEQGRRLDYCSFCEPFAAQLALAGTQLRDGCEDAPWITRQELHTSMPGLADDQSSYLVAFGPEDPGPLADPCLVAAASEADEDGWRLLFAEIFVYSMQGQASTLNGYSFRIVVNDVGTVQVNYPSRPVEFEPN